MEGLLFLSVNVCSLNRLNWCLEEEAAVQGGFLLGQQSGPALLQASRPLPSSTSRSARLCRLPSACYTSWRVTGCWGRRISSLWGRMESGAPSGGSEDQFLSTRGSGWKADQAWARWAGRLRTQGAPLTTPRQGWEHNDLRGPFHSKILSLLLWACAGSWVTLCSSGGDFRPKSEVSQRLRRTEAIGTEGGWQTCGDLSGFPGGVVETSLWPSSLPTPLSCERTSWDFYNPELPNS